MENKQILKMPSNKNQSLTVIYESNKEVEELDSNTLQYISNVEKEINYTFVEDYKKYLLNARLKLKKNILMLPNENEKLIKYFYSMDPNNEIYILKFQNFDLELKNKLVSFAELENNDILCFEKQTNKIGIYNHEKNIFNIIADNWDNFINELYDDCIYKTKNGFEYKYKGLKAIITADEIKEELIIYAKQVIDYYYLNKEKVNNHLFEKFEKDDWYVKEYTRDEIVDKIGRPTIYVSDVNCAEITYLDNKLDEHIITIELFGLELSYVTVDG